MNKQLLLTTACCLLFTACCFSQPGNLDSDFDSDGKQTVDFDSQDDKAYGVVVQPDGKTIVAGYSRILGDHDFSMARFNTDGTYDATFGIDGKVSTSFSSGDEIARAILLQPDGKIILAGYMINGTSDFAMARYTTSGTLDNTFSDDGILFTDFTNSADVCKAAALQPDGKIILAGESYGQTSYDFALVRYNSNGTLDNTFGTGGKVTTLFTTSASTASANAVVVQPDGKIVAAGEYKLNGGPTSAFALARYNADGTLDNTFSVDGKVTTSLGDDNVAEINAIALQSNGYIVAGGYSFISGNNYVGLTRYKTDGTLDTGFDGDGKVISNAFSYTGQTRALALQTDGKIIAAGYGEVNPNHGFGIVRFNQDGSPDNTFGSGGTVFTDFNTNNDEANAVAIQPDLKIVLAGFQYNGSDFDFAVARYLSGLNLGVLGFSENASPLIYPNPVNENTVLAFELSNNENLNILIYDALGKQVKQICENKFFNSGKQELNINATELASGQYTLVIENEKGNSVIRLQK